MPHATPLSLRERACPERSEGAGERGSNKKWGVVNELLYANHLKIYTRVVPDVNPLKINQLYCDMRSIQ